ncbi:MAG TPA: ORF6N domain-containing protein [Chthoniobacterales bacterium]|nr:ORF6N domain-containing protein [Chthoniobacterales bacterium]
MPSKKLTRPDHGIDNLIQEIRGQRVILDSDLARLYGVPTFRFNEAVKRNRKRFPPDFMFQITIEENRALTSQIAISKTGRGGRRTPPFAFTEHGALQAANILNSARAVQMSVFVIRAFVKMRETLLGTRDLAKKLTTLEKQLTGRLDSHEAVIFHVLQELMLILNPPPNPPAPPRPKIGFSQSN